METHRAAIEAEMKAVLKCDGDQPDLFYGMMQYHMGWRTMELAPENLYNGKKIRPILLLLTCEAEGGDWHQAIPAAAAIELLHNFSLIHDDIQDVSDTRRGRLTNWKIWGEAQAINTGDAIFASAQLAMARLSDRGVDPAIVVQALKRLNETCILLTQGQFRDMSFETRNDVKVDEYTQMIRGKTAVLVALSAELGALIAGANKATVSHYHQFGLDTGLAFQVIDDILGIWGDEAEIGKSASSDIMTKKKSIPVLHGLEHSEALRTHYQLSSETAGFVETTISLLDSVGSRAYAEQLAESYTASAFHHLESATPEGEAGQALIELANMLLARNS